MLATIHWNVDPILLDLGPLQLRYYGLCFAACIYTAFGLWHREALRNGHSLKFADDFLWYGVLGTLIGARLGHCLFYEPERYLSNPIEILYFWKGGLASHGSTAALIFSVWLFSRVHKVTFMRSADMVSPGIALAAGWVRIGNFFNSEIVGRPTDLPWAVVFERYDGTPRHPTAFYEVLMGIVAFLIIAAIRRRDIRRAGSGLYFGLFMAVYFSFRFLVEFFKARQVGKIIANDDAHFLVGWSHALGLEYPLTMGQWLSVPAVLTGLGFIAWALLQDRDAIPAATPTRIGRDGRELGGDEDAPDGSARRGKGKPRKKKR